MNKSYVQPQGFSTADYVAIPMTPVDSSQVKAVGYDASTKTLAVTFTRGTGAIYHYPNVEPELHAEFVAAESKGSFFGSRVKHLPFEKFPASVAA